VFGRGELVIDTVEIAKRYCRRFFIADVFSVLPLPQLVIWKFLYREDKTAVLETKDRLLSIIIAQYVPRLVRIYPLSTELKHQQRLRRDGPRRRRLLPPLVHARQPYRGRILVPAID
jgi:hypothetical protein